VYEVLYDYVLRAYKEKQNTPLELDLYYYEGVSRINEFLCKGETKPISVNNGNDILTSLIIEDSIISERTYQHLWRNLRIQIHYDKDEWIMEYWKMASQKMYLFMNPLNEYMRDGEDEPYTIEQIEENKRQREEFMEFHIMLCALLLQQRKYGLLELMLSFTQSEPPSYPLVPSTLSEIIDSFSRVNNKSFSNPFLYERKYPMPNMHGITEGKIVGAASCYLALLIYRIYVIRWDYGHESILNIGTLPNTLAELRSLRDLLEEVKYWIERIKYNKELLDIINFRSFEEELKDKGVIDSQTKHLRPEELVTNMQKEISLKMQVLKVTLPLSIEKIESEEDELTDNILRAMKPYDDFLKKPNGKQSHHNLNSSVTMPFPNTAFVNNPDISQVGIADSMSSYMLTSFQQKFAASFFSENSSVDYRVSTEDLFDAIDKLNLNKEHYIIAFGVYFDNYVRKIRELKKETNHEYRYRDVKILALNCNIEYFSQMLYVMRFDDLPILDFQEPSQAQQKELNLNVRNAKYGLWLSINKISEHPELLKEPIKTKLGNKADENSLFTAIWVPRLFFNQTRFPMVRIKVRYLLRNEGEYDSVDKIKSFSEEI